MDAELRIVESKSSCQIRCKELANLIKDFSIAFQSLKAVRKHFGHIERPPVLARQFHADVVEISFGIRAEVNNNVVQRALRATHQFGLSCRDKLEMESAHCAALAGHGNTALNKSSGEALFSKFPGTKCTRKESAGIFVGLRLHNISARQLRLYKFHEFRFIPRAQCIAKLFLPEKLVVNLLGAYQEFKLLEPRKGSMLKNFRRHVNFLK